MSAARAVTATFARPSFALAVTRLGSGTVTSSPAGISCGATCSASFTGGTSVTLTAVPATGFGFTGWSGACNGASTCTVTMNAAASVTASFSALATFTDNPLVAGSTPMKATHISELRTAVNAARTRNGLTVSAWTDPVLTPGSVTIKAIHVVELRTALNQVYTRLGRTLPAYTDPTIVPGQTASKAAHIQELRKAVTALP
jgi:hypothetical protein